MTNDNQRLIDLIEGISAEKDMLFKPVSMASDIMTTDIKTLTMDHTVKACLNFMESHRVRHVAIVDTTNEEQKPYFIGVISDRDVLRHALPLSGNKTQLDKDENALRKLLGQLVARNLEVVSETTLIPDIISKMIDYRIDAMPVVEDKRLVGIVTTTAILRIYSRLESVIQQFYPELEYAENINEILTECTGDKETLIRWLYKPVSEIMTQNVVTLKRDDTIQTAKETLQKGHFRHAPVINENGRLDGIISDRDILRCLPFAGRRPLLPEKRFREYLFSVRSQVSNLKIPVEQVMVSGKRIKVVTPDCPVFEAAWIMRKKKISSLAVTDEERTLLGLITTTDLMKNTLTVYQMPGCTETDQVPVSPY